MCAAGKPVASALLGSPRSCCPCRNTGALLPAAGTRRPEPPPARLAPPAPRMAMHHCASPCIAVHHRTSPCITAHHRVRSPAAHRECCRQEWVRGWLQEQAGQAAAGVHVRKGEIVIASSAMLRAGDVCVVRNLGYSKANKEKRLLRPL